MTKPIALLAVALALAAIAAACNGPSPSPAAATPPQPTPHADFYAVDLNKPFPLGMGRRAELLDATFLVDFRSVTNDSRCPVDVTCIRAGDAAVTLRIRTGSADSQEIALVFPTPDKAMAQVGTYRIAVTGLAPAARAGQPIPQSAYVVTLLITPA